MAIQSSSSLARSIDQPVVWCIEDQKELEAHIKENPDVRCLKIVTKSMTSFPKSITELQKLHKLEIVSKNDRQFIQQFCFSPSSLRESFPNLKLVLFYVLPS